MKSCLSLTALIAIGVAGSNLGCRGPALVDPYPMEPYRSNKERLLEWEALQRAVPLDVDTGPPSTSETSHWCVPIEGPILGDGPLPLTRQWVKDSDRVGRANNKLREN